MPLPQAGSVKSTSGQLPVTFCGVVKLACMKNVLPLSAIPGVQSKVVLNGLALVVPSAGVNVAELGLPVALRVRSFPGSVALTTVENGTPMGKVNTPPPGQLESVRK